MIASLSENSLKQYDCCLKKWHAYCIQNQLDYLVTSIPDVIKFLTQLYNSGAKYGTLNSCRSALSLILNYNIGNVDVIKRLFKGFYRLRPSNPKYEVTWDPEIVLNHLFNLYPNESLNLKDLTLKTVTLLTLVTAHRAQTLSKISIDNIENRENSTILKITNLIKTSRANASQPLLVLPNFNKKPEICPASVLRTYVSVTQSLRGEEKTLFIGFRKPYRAVTAQTISRWVKTVLKDSGVDTNIFSAHSTRHASTSLAKQKGVSLDLIRKTAGWSGNSTVFARFYNRVIVNDNPENFARSLCDAFDD